MGMRITKVSALVRDTSAAAEVFGRVLGLRVDPAEVVDGFGMKKVGRGRVNGAVIGERYASTA